MNRQEILAEVEEKYGFVPEFYVAAPDAILDMWWRNSEWLKEDTALSARDKILVSFGAAAALHCQHCVPYHTAQLAVFGLDERQMNEASWAANLTAGSSTYLYGIGYNMEKFKEELDRIIAHFPETAQE
jgi:AhpD family alkylhydroperoxidase